jgi:toxin ParE1/3/4
MRVRFTLQARSDLRAIFDYIASDNAARARSFVDELEARCRQIAEQPELGPSRADLGVGLRMVVFGRYLIFYVTSGDLVRIVRVVHGVRNLTNLF